MKKLTKLQKLENDLDEAWRVLVKLKAGGKCEVCGKKENLNAHHIFTRRNKAVRWCLDNGLALCPFHHTLNSKFSAHATPVTFHPWLVKNRGQSFLDLLTFKSNQISKLHIFEKQIILKELQEEINDIKPSIL